MVGWAAPPIHGFSARRDRRDAKGGMKISFAPPVGRRDHLLSPPSAYLVNASDTTSGDTRTENEGSGEQDEQNFCRNRKVKLERERHL